MTLRNNHVGLDPASRNRNDPPYIAAGNSVLFLPQSYRSMSDDRDPVRLIEEAFGAEPTIGVVAQQDSTVEDPGLRTCATEPSRACSR